MGKLLDVLGLVDLCVCWETADEEDDDDDDDAVEEGRDFFPSGGGGRPNGER